MTRTERHRAFTFIGAEVAGRWYVAVCCFTVMRIVSDEDREAAFARAVAWVDREFPEIVVEVVA